MDPKYTDKRENNESVWRKVYVVTINFVCLFLLLEENQENLVNI